MFFGKIQAMNRRDQTKQTDLKLSMEYIETKIDEDPAFIGTISNSQLQEYCHYAGTVDDSIEDMRLLAQEI